ncbi:MAG TPA: hypothetical protein VN887_05930 [Candidatus Angelobacter sp.]|nr:hypothetical protein [Candidatus Angelobacter sp.]
MAKKTQPTTGDLLGRWKTGTVQTEWGASVLEITFPSASDIEFKMKPVAGGQSIVSKGNYRLRGSQLISAAINKGEPVSVWLEDDQLVIQTPPEPPQRFVRK